MTLRASVPWAGCAWALPFLTVRAPSGRYAAERGQRHRKLTGWARQALLQTARWLPGRRVIAVAGSSFSTIEPLRDAGFYKQAPPRKPGAVRWPPARRAETQRQWSDLAILRAKPCLLGLFSLATPWATQLQAGQGAPPECGRWHPKHAPTFSDALARVRLELSRAWASDCLNAMRGEGWPSLDSIQGLGSLPTGWRRGP